MPAYQFEALSEDGATRKGVIEAGSAKSARGALRLQSLIPLSVETLHGADGKSKSLLQRDLFNAKVFGNSALTVLTRQLAGLVTAGLPLERAFAALTEEAPRESQRNLLSALRADVNWAALLQKHCRNIRESFRMSLWRSLAQASKAASLAWYWSAWRKTWKNSKPSSQN